jgi:hypothetical protein
MQLDGSPSAASTGPEEIRESFGSKWLLINQDFEESR